MTEKPYSLLLAPGAQRTLIDQLPEAAAFAAWEFIPGPLAMAPTRVGAPLRAPFEGHYRAHRGDYRIRYDIHDATQTPAPSTSTTAGTLSILTPNRPPPNRS